MVVNKLGENIKERNFVKEVDEYRIMSLLPMSRVKRKKNLLRNLGVFFIREGGKSPLPLDQATFEQISRQVETEYYGIVGDSYS